MTVKSTALLLMSGALLLIAADLLFVTSSGGMVSLRLGMVLLGSYLALLGLALQIGRRRRICGSPQADRRRADLLAHDGADAANDLPRERYQAETGEFR